MYSLRLTCWSSEVDELSAELWERGTIGVRELELDEKVVLIAGFETNRVRIELLRHFANYSPEWEREDAIDWVRQTQLAWPARPVGERIFLAPPWSIEATPPGRIRLRHNPGLACGTGEHPCTQLALEAIERQIRPGVTVVDIGTGSGILAIAALQLGARRVAGTDLDEAALHAAAENFALNDLLPQLIVGSADCLRSQCSDLTVANISGSVLLSIMDHLVRITSPSGRLILTGFPESELPAFLQLFPDCEVSGRNEWRCILASMAHA